MSHFEVSDVISANPTIPTMFPTDDGTAIPAANTLNIFGGTGINTAAAGNTVTINLDGSVATLYTANVGTATPLANNLDILGSFTVAGSGDPLVTVASGHTVTVQVQLASAQVSSSANQAGIASFNSTEFSVDANGYVSTSGIFSETLTGNSGGGVGPTLGNINTLGAGSITVVGNPGTSTLTSELTGLTEYNVLVGQGTTTIGLIVPSTSGFVLTSNGATAYPTFQAISTSGAVTQFTTSDSNTVTPSSGNVNLFGTGSITTVGSGATATFELTGLTSHAVLVGAGTPTITNVGPDSVSGIPLISQGASADPIFGTAVVGGGGTGDVSFTAFMPITGGTTTTAPLQSVSTSGAVAGDVLTFVSTSALPTWQTASATGAITKINGDSGSMTPTAGAVTISGGTTGLTTLASTSTMDLTGTLVVANGGTGNTTFTAYSVICAGTTATGVFQNVSGLGSSGNVLTSNGAGALPTWHSPAASSITFTGDSGTPFSTSSVTITGGTTGLTFAAATPDLTLGGILGLSNGGTNASLTASNGGIFYSTASAGAILAGTATAHQLLLSGASTAPVWSTSTYPTTNAVSTLLYASSANVMAALTTGNNGVLITSSSGVPSWLGAGTTGQVLTATTGSPATWASAAASSITLTGDTGGALTGASFTFNANAQNLSGGFAGSGTTLTLKVSDASTNLFLGQLSGKTGYSGSGNCGVGYSTFTSITSGASNTAFGTSALGNMTTGTNNTAIGNAALNGSAGSFTGSYNCALGLNAGLGYASTESSNICIGYNTQGTTGESNVLRIGNGLGTGNGQLAKAFIQGISGVTVTGTAVLCSTGGQLGTIASSIRYKENIENMNSSDSLLKLRPVSFNYKDEEEKIKHFGFIAEEVEQYFPELIVYDDDGKPETIKYHEMYAMLLNEIQRLNARLIKLENK